MSVLCQALLLLLVLSSPWSCWALRPSSCPTQPSYGQPNCLRREDYSHIWRNSLDFTSDEGPCFQPGDGAGGDPRCFVNAAWHQAPCDCRHRACRCKKRFARECSGKQVL